MGLLQKILVFISNSGIVNLRGSDVEYNPVFFSYLILTHKKLLLFVDEYKLLNDSLVQLNIEKVDFSLRKYEDILLGIDEMVSEQNYIFSREHLKLKKKVVNFFSE